MFYLTPVSASLVSAANKRRCESDERPEEDDQECSSHSSTSSTSRSLNRDRPVYTSYNNNNNNNNNNNDTQSVQHSPSARDSTMRPTHLPQTLERGNTEFGVRTSYDWSRSGSQPNNSNTYEPYTTNREARGGTATSSTPLPCKPIALPAYMSANWASTPSLRLGNAPSPQGGDSPSLHVDRVAATDPRFWLNNAENWSRDIPSAGLQHTAYNTRTFSEVKTEQHLDTYMELSRQINDNKLSREITPTSSVSRGSIPSLFPPAGPIKSSPSPITTSRQPWRPFDDLVDQHPSAPAPGREGGLLPLPRYSPPEGQVYGMVTSSIDSFSTAKSFNNKNYNPFYDGRQLANIQTFNRQQDISGGGGGSQQQVIESGVCSSFSWLRGLENTHNTRPSSSEGYVIPSRVSECHTSPEGHMLQRVNDRHVKDSPEDDDDIVMKENTSNTFTREAPHSVMIENTSNTFTREAPHSPRYPCSNCGRSYMTASGLTRHKQRCNVTVEGGDVPSLGGYVSPSLSCQQCHKIYSSLGALKMHIRTHTLPCQCTVCGKSFSRPWLLQGHLRTHTGERPFGCTQCTRAFADRSNLRAHLQTHSESKKYCCQACGKTFSRHSLLVKHSKSSDNTSPCSAALQCS